MTAEPAQKILARAATIPTNRIVRADPDLLAQYPPLRAAAASTKAYRPSGRPDYSAVTRAIYTNVNLALRGRLDPGEALRRAERESERTVHTTPG
jgi:multiple sugar transport system substrate-binding protein